MEQESDKSKYSIYSTNGDNYILFKQITGISLVIVVIVSLIELLLSKRILYSKTTNIIINKPKKN